MPIAQIRTTTRYRERTLHRHSGTVTIGSSLFEARRTSDRSALSLDFGLTPEGMAETEADSEAEFAFGACSESSAIASTTGAKAAERREGSAFPD